MKPTLIEIAIIVLLLVMTIPDLCRRLGRPSLIYVTYLICGMFIVPRLSIDIREIVTSIGEIGFILLLFEIGLEIEIPKQKDMLSAAKLASLWGIIQIPLIALLAKISGLGPLETILACCGLCACSVGIAFQGWMHYPEGTSDERVKLLHWMILLEVAGMIFLTSGELMLHQGTGTSFVLALSGIIVALLAIGLFANKTARLVARLSRNTLRWRAHYWVLFILLAASAGRLAGFSPAKTAFFLGLFISRTTHDGLALEHHLRPIGQHLLIPVFFLSLGGSIPYEYWMSKIGVYAIVSAAIILLYRRLIQQWILRGLGGKQAYLLVTPSLTITAVAAQAMNHAQLPAQNMTWLLMTSAVLTLYSLIALRQRNPANPVTSS